MVDCWPRSAKEGVFSRLHFPREFELVHPDSSLLGGEGDHFVAFDARFAAGDPTEASYLELPPVAFLFEADQCEVGGATTVMDINVEDGLTVADDIFGLRAVQIRVPAVFVSQAVGEHAAGLAADLGLTDDLSLDAGEGEAVLPVDADLRWREVWVVDYRRGPYDDGADRRGRIDHHLEDFIGDLGRLEFLEAVDAGVELQSSSRAGGADFGDDDVVREAEAHHVDDVLIGDPRGELLAERVGTEKKEQKCRQKGLPSHETSSPSLRLGPARDPCMWTLEI